MLIWISVCPAAKAAEVTASVDRTTIAIDQGLNLTLSIQGESADPDISVIRDFIIQNSGTSTNIQIINGKTTKKVEYQYLLVPKRTGILEIPGIPVILDGKTETTEKITVKVTEEPETNSKSKTEVFVSAEVSAEKIYQGQQFVYIFKLFNCTAAANVGLQQPDFSGFSVKQIQGEKKYSTVISGIQYNVTEIGFALMPLKTGKFSIEPAYLRCDIVSKKSGGSSFFDNFFNDPFFGKTNLEPVNVGTKSIDVEVKALPQYKGDIEFSGLVGKFGIKSDVKKTTVKAGDSVTFNVEIEGEGNIMDAEFPAMVFPDSFKIYKDKPVEDVSLDYNGFSGKKIFRSALVPVRHGNFTIPAVKICCFDTDENKYKIVSSSAIQIRVLPSEDEKTSQVLKEQKNIRKPAKQKVEFTGRDILPLKKEIDAIENKSGLSFKMFLLLLFFPFVFFVVIRFAFPLLKKKEDAKTVMSERCRNALKNARKNMDSDKEFLSFLYKAIIFAVLSKAGVKGETLDNFQIKNILKEERIYKKTTEILNQIERSRYGGTDVDSDKKKKLFLHVKRLVKEFL